MLSKNTLTIIEFLLRNVSAKYSINKLAKNLKISVGSAHKILKNMESKKLVIYEKLGSSIFYSLNTKNREAQKLCELVLIESKNNVLNGNPTAQIYAREIEKFSGAKAIILFGSILTKKEKANDVDVLFIVKNKTDVKKVSRVCLDISKLKTKPIVPLIMTEHDLRKKIKERNSIVLDIIKTGVVLTGEDITVRSIFNVQN